ncbi:MAG TPA: glycosyltransferase family 2 protein [Candidatus Paceibacterota bacterium]|nr:glycosyltransferase family 2 protein [Candidatus Paceibacterota bacterium]
MLKVSILMATYNRAGLIDSAVESAQKQSFKDWELIIADDGSVDNTKEVVSKLLEKDSRIIYTRSEVNQGISKNYNRGLRLAKGEYVAMLDDDDPWCDPEKLEKQIKFLDKNPEYVGCGGGMIVIDGKGKPARLASESVAGREIYRYLKPETDEAIRNKMLFGNPMANSTTMFRRSAGEKVGWYDESTRYSGDRDFWLKMGLIGKLYNAPEYFSYYLLANDNTSVKKAKPHLKASLMIMKRYKEKYPHYFLALIFNELQYFYAFIPESIRKKIHPALARIKRKLAG